MFKKITGTLLLANLACAAFAQDSTKTFALSGSVDAYYRVGGGKDSAGEIKTNNLTSFTNSANSFELGMASLRADATALSGKVGATVDLGFGTRATEFSYNDGSTPLLAAIKQAYITYAPVSALKFTVGKFGTHVGYELLDAPLNRNYSMSYMFTNGPFFHTGVKADITAGKIGLMVGVTNHVDYSTTAGSPTAHIKNLIGQVSYTSNAKIKAYLNYWGYFGDKEEASGAESQSQLDLVVLGTITDKFNIGLNGTYRSAKMSIYDPITQKTDSKTNSWFGTALYLNYDPSSAVGVTLRGEYIGNDDGLLSSVASKNIFESTLSLNYKVGPFTLIPEVRIDSAADEIFTKGNGAGTKSAISGVFAAIYKF